MLTIGSDDGRKNDSDNDDDGPFDYLIGSQIRCAGGQPRDEVISINERLRCVRIRLDESYKTAKRALIQLNAHYNDSKTASVLRRYALLKAMIKVNSNLINPQRISKQSC